MSREGANDLTEVSAFIIVPIGREMLHPATADNLVRAQKKLLSLGIGDVDIRFHRNRTHIHLARSHAVHLFLESKHTHLFWIDSDMTFHADSVVRLLRLATKPGIDVVGAAGRYRIEPPKFVAKLPKGVQATNEYGLIAAESYGLAFACQTRKALADLSASTTRFARPNSVKKDALAFPLCVDFGFDQENKEVVGEDVELFRRLRELGYTCWLDPRISLGHIGDKEFSGRFLDTLTVTG